MTDSSVQLQVDTGQVAVKFLKLHTRTSLESATPAFFYLNRSP